MMRNGVGLAAVWVGLLVISLAVGASPARAEAQAPSGLSADCDRGSASACFSLAVAYQDGSGVAQSYDQAITFYRKALAINPNLSVARDNMAIAVGLRGKIPVKDPAVEARAAYAAGVAAEDRKDFSTAARQYEAACTAGLLKGCFAAGYAHEHGEGVAANPARAAAYFTKACDGDYGRGCTSLGLLYANGKGVKQDKARAARLYLKGCDGGEAAGCFDLAGLYERGEGVARSDEQAIAFYRRALVIDPGLDLASTQISIVRDRQKAGGKAVAATPEQAFDVGLAAYDRKDFATAARNFTLACDGKFARGCYNLGVMNSQGTGVATDKARAAQLFEAACVGKSANGCFNLALAYDDGAGVAHDLVKATAFYAKACNIGNAMGCYNTAVSYVRGDGVSKSDDRAITYYRKALVIDAKMAIASQGITDAQQRLAAKR